MGLIGFIQRKDRVRNLVSLGTGGKFLRSLLWQELGISMASMDGLKKMLSLSMPFLGAIIDVIDIKRL